MVVEKVENFPKFCAEFNVSATICYSLFSHFTKKKLYILKILFHNSYVSCSNGSYLVSKLLIEYDTYVGSIPFNRAFISVKVCT